MKKSLVIVESPSKAKTINKFLGDEFIVKASVGHIKNLPDSKLGVDIEKGFKPEWVTIPRQKKVLAEIKKYSAECDKVYIATDPDREGEAIAQHIAKEIKTKSKNVFRALFNEITFKAVHESIDNPLEIDSKKVDAQQARRVLDRIVGYKVSPVLWKTVYKGSLSAGRVQSVALKLICNREVEVLAFKPEEYWSIHVELTPEQREKDVITAKLTKLDGKAVTIPDKETADKFLADCRASKYAIKNVIAKKVQRKPNAPYITSTIQQDASTRIGFSPSKTMMVAQQLYEGLELGGEGSVSLITYMRTDSLRMSDEALASIRSYIESKYGAEYLPKAIRVYKAKGKAKVQDAHECIRPTYFDHPPESVKPFLNADQFKLYQLIWNRTLASQMKEAQFNQTSVVIGSGNYEFRAAGSVLLFPGFLKVMQEIKSENGKEEEEFTPIPANLEKNMPLNLMNENPEQHFTQPPPRFSESSLVKELDMLGIGRPSTYALIIRTLKDRTYITREKKRLIPSELGVLVNKIISNNFSTITNVDFTADMELELDLIEDGSKKYSEVLENFYTPFRENLETVEKNIKVIKKGLEVKAEFKCEKCESDMILKWSKYGKFYACSGFPACKNIRQLDGSKSEKGEKKEKPALQKSGINCEKCGSDMVIRTGRFGKFLGCSGYPKCKNILKYKDYADKIVIPEELAKHAEESKPEE